MLNILIMFYRKSKSNSSIQINKAKKKTNPKITIRGYIELAVTSYTKTNSGPNCNSNRRIITYNSLKCRYHWKLQIIYQIKIYNCECNYDIVHNCKTDVRNDSLSLNSNECIHEQFDSVPL